MLINFKILVRQVASWVGVNADSKAVHNSIKQVIIE